MRNAHCRTWNMERKLKNMDNKTKTVQELEYEKYTLKVLDYGEKTDQHGKCDTHTLGSEIWRETVKNVKMRNAHCMIWNMEKNTEKVGK